MADNTQLNAGSGGDVVAGDDIGGVKYQRCKLIHGVDGTNDGDVSKTNPLPSIVRAFATDGSTAVNVADATSSSIRVLQAPNSVTVAANNTGTASSNTNVTLTYTAAGAGIRYVLSGIAWSYNGTPTAGRLIIKNNGSSGTTVFDIDITAAGPGFIPFNPPKLFGSNVDVFIELFAGGSGVVGKLNVLGITTDTNFG